MRKVLYICFSAVLFIVAGCQQGGNPSKDESLRQKQQLDINAGMHNRYESEDTENNRRPEWRTLSDPSVIGGRVQVENGRAVGRLVLDKDVDEEQAHRIAQRYAIEIKQVYTRFPANVHVVQEGINQFTVQLK